MGFALKENKYLQDVDFSANEIDPVSFNDFLKSIRLTTHVKHLSIAENHLGNAGAKGLAEFLKSNKSIKTLKLSCLASFLFLNESKNNKKE